MSAKVIDPQSSEVSVITGEGESPIIANEADCPPQVIDVESPKSWPVWQKILHTAVPGLLGFTVMAGSSAYSPGIQPLADYFGTSRIIAVLGLSLYSEGLAIGPIIGAPLSEALGRRGVYLTTAPLLILFTMAAGLARNVETFIICRFLAALVGSPALAIGAGTVADLWDMQREGGIVSVVFISTFFMGPSVGPVIGGFALEMQHTWRWLMWALMLATAPILIVLVFTKETSLKHIQRATAKKLGVAPPSTAASSMTFKSVIVGTLGRPLLMIVKEPIVAAWALYHAFVFGVLFGFFGSYYYVYETVYGFTPAQVGLAFLAVFVGAIMAIITFALVDKLVYQKRRRLFPDGKAPAEERLYSCMLGAWLLPISLFWFAWTARPDIHFMVPIAAGVPFGWGLLLLTCGGIVYLLDTYGSTYGASAVAANGIMRYTFGAAFPLFTLQMYQRLGIPWASSLLGFISIGLLPIPFVLYKYGPALRARSSFTSTVTH